MLLWETGVTLASLALFAVLAARFGTDRLDGLADPSQPPLGSCRGSAARRRRTDG